MHIKKGDKVVVITGKDKGKKGTVERAFPNESRVIVAGVHIVKVHERARKANAKGTIVEKAMPIHVSNVKLADAKPAKVAKKSANK
jgi:large subunit ribosomal protein L24